METTSNATNNQLEFLRLHLMSLGHKFDDDGYLENMIPIPGEVTSSFLMSKFFKQTDKERSLQYMRDTSALFYNMAIHCGCHAFIEFCGLQQKFINSCQAAHAKGIDFTNLNKHVGGALPMSLTRLSA